MALGMRRSRENKVKARAGRTADRFCRLRPMEGERDDAPRNTELEIASQVAIA
jgi:hypothetical protein